MGKKQQQKKKQQQQTQGQQQQQQQQLHQVSTDQQPTTSAAKEIAGGSFKRISAQKRNELNELVMNLRKITFLRKFNPNEQWQDYVEMQAILERIQTIESCLKFKGSGGKNRAANVEAFNKWADENDVKHDGVRIAEFPGFDLGLEATKDIIKGDPIIIVPRKLILSEELLGSRMSLLPFEPKMMSNLKLTYVLMWEKVNPESFWKPYIDLLPEKYSTVLYYSVNDMQELKGTSALSQAIAQCKNIARQYAMMYQNFQQMKQKSVLAERFSYDLYRWGVSTVMTRENIIPRLDQPEDEDSTHGFDTIASLIPFWDMANHKDGTITSFFNMELCQLESSALTDFQKGEQIFIYYGDRSNADLLVHNGFVYPDNKKDSVSIKLGLSSSDELLTERTKLLEMLEIPKNTELKVFQAPLFISPKLLAFVRIFNMNKEQLEHWIENRATDLFHIDCALETSLESKTWLFLQTRLSLLLRVFPTTLEEDELALQNHEKGQTKVGYLKALILQYRILEKRILTNALDYAKQRTKA
ncbi:actin-histidine N-methyltransferase [Episyrphus balteatus]|uniref:actin-histidine N-methyltransferase n=1 Tax=Episyrphus balteatus TaxID=286459 RepID=UPI002486B074|nr:actin-histidine N-methyltransferase [Episyrphus balteatus]